QVRYKNIDTSSVGTTIDSFKSTYGNEYLTTAEQIIGYPITNEQDIRDYLTLSLYTEELFKEFIPVTDEQIQTAFTEKYAEEVGAHHILIEDEAQAQKVLDAIKSGTYTVEEVVTDQTIVGEDIIIKEASDLSYFKKGQMVAEFETAAFALEKDATSTELVKTEFGYHIINVYDQKTNELTDELKETIASDLRSAEKTRANYQTFMTDIREEAGVEITNEAVKTAYDELMTSLTTPAE
ncbi:MAG: peptidylprolyl isomerase, partial [Culicoidibacterales bacterium]